MQGVRDPVAGPQPGSLRRGRAPRVFWTGIEAAGDQGKADLGSPVAREGARDPEAGPARHPLVGDRWKFFISLIFFVSVPQPFSEADLGTVSVPLRADGHGNVF